MVILSCWLVESSLFSPWWSVLLMFSVMLSSFVCFYMWIRLSSFVWDSAPVCYCKVYFWSLLPANICLIALSMRTFLSASDESALGCSLNCFSNYELSKAIICSGDIGGAPPSVVDSGLNPKTELRILDNPWLDIYSSLFIPMATLDKGLNIADYVLRPFCNWLFP